MGASELTLVIKGRESNLRMHRAHILTFDLKVEWIGTVAQKIDVFTGK
jgi:hypothetical protein